MTIDRWHDSNRGLDERISNLAPGVDGRVRDELQALLATLGGETPYPIGALLGTSRLSLWLVKNVLVLAGRKPSDNLLSCITRAAGDDVQAGQRLLPAELASYLHNIRILSNKARHDVEAVTLTEMHAEIAITQFLALLEWFYCRYEHQPHRLDSLYAVEAKPAPSPVERQQGWRIPGQHVVNFIGRDEILERLAEGLASAASVPHAITGLAGVGKTQLVVEYAQRHVADYDVAWWIRAAEPATLASDFTALGAMLGLPDSSDRDNEVVRGAVRDWLTHHDRWLLVFDNVEQPRDLAGYLPGGLGHVLITSQNPNWGGVAAPFALGPLPRAHAAQFLLRRTGQADAAAAEALAEALGDLPLALEQAGAYLEETQTPLTEYVVMLARRQEALLERGAPTGYPGTVATTWALAFDRVERRDAAAAQLLRLCAFFHADGVPLDLLTGGASDLPSPLGRAVSDPVTLNEAVATLRRFSLVERKRQSLTVHRLVQAVTRTTLAGLDRRRWAARAVRLVWTAFPKDAAPIDVRNWEECERLLASAIAVTEHAEQLRVELELTSLLLDRLATYLQVRGRLGSARAGFERALRIAEEVFGPEHPETADILNNLGLLLRDLGQPAAARVCLERSLALHEAARGPDSAEVSSTLNNLGGVLIDLGELEAAKARLERCLAIREAASGPEYPGLVLPLSHLGTVMRDLGEPHAARVYFERALAIPEGEAAIGTGFLTRAVRLSNLGTVLGDLGEFEAARSYLEQAVALEEEMLGPDHPKVADRLNELATVLHRLGDPQAAQGHVERALEIHETILGPGHRKVAAELHNLGLVLRDLGHVQAARSCLERALASYEAILGPDHSVTRTAALALERL